MALKKLNEISTNVRYKKLPPEEQKKRGILGQLYGVIADFKNPTRNGRLYSEKLWDNVFEDPIMQEKIATKTVMGELGHPEDRTEIDMEKVAIILDGVPTKTSDGKLVGLFNIIDTPNGRILKTLCDYGCQIGVSSRGEGDTDMDFYGNETVNPDTYQCECWDAVVVPSVKDARLSLVESLGKDKYAMCKEALNEELTKATPDDRRVMMDTLNTLNIMGTTSSKAVGNIEAGGKETIQAVKDLVAQNARCENENMRLQEKLSACNARVSQCSQTISTLSAENMELRKELNSVTFENHSLKADNQSLRSANKKLTEQFGRGRSQRQPSKMGGQRVQLQSSDTVDNDQVKLNENAQQLNVRLTEEIKAHKKSEARCRKLEEDLQSSRDREESAKQNAVILKQKYTKALADSNKTVQALVEKYIGVRSEMLGINPNAVKKRLGESYSLAELDDVFDELDSENEIARVLPFEVKKPISKIKMTEQAHTAPLASGEHDDEVDTQLLRLVQQQNDKNPMA